MILPTWGDLADTYCTATTINHPRSGLIPNPYYEEMALRRYNYSPSLDTSACRLVFLSSALQASTNRTLGRSGRFIWCKNLNYIGKREGGYRYVSFSVDRGQKRFTVGERDMVCIPSQIFINNNRYFRTPHKIFTPFSTVFGYPNTLKMMANIRGISRKEMAAVIRQDSPFGAGTLVVPRLGYFYPQSPTPDRRDKEHPCGIILGPSLDNGYGGRELYRVRFGDTTYEQVHPVQLEIINEV
jgi:hypothetical protein